MNPYSDNPYQAPTPTSIPTTHATRPTWAEGMKTIILWSLGPWIGYGLALLTPIKVQTSVPIEVAIATLSIGVVLGGIGAWGLRNIISHSRLGDP